MAKLPKMTYNGRNVTGIDYVKKNGTKVVRYDAYDEKGNVIFHAHHGTAGNGCYTKLYTVYCDGTFRYTGVTTPSWQPTGESYWVGDHREDVMCQHNNDHYKCNKCGREIEVNIGCLSNLPQHPKGTVPSVCGKEIGTGYTLGCGFDAN